jgi:N-acetyl sugar amidotransferase
MTSHNKKMQRCSRCILPSTYSGIKFYPDGTCNICHEWDKEWKNRDFSKLKDTFVKMFSQKKNKYDCIVPFSGGKDSSYLLYMLKKKLHLNPLAVNLNNHFQTAIARSNLELVVKKLEIDLISFSPDFKNYCELMKRCFLKSTIPCLPCDVGIHSLAYKTALMFKVDTIVFSGGKLASPKKPGRALLMYESLKKVNDSFKKKIDLSNYLITTDMIKNVKIIYYGDYFDWKEKEILETVVQRLGWRLRGVEHSRIDCEFEPILNFIYSKRQGFSKKCLRLSKMIRDGQISKEEALELDKKYLAEKEPRNLERILSGIGVPKKSLQRQIKGNNLLKPLWYH